MLSSFLIGLREGLEASLIVAILVAYLVRTGNKQALGRLWAGVGAAVAVAIALGLLLTFVEGEMGEQAAEAFAGFTSLLAVGLITWMIFWMAKNARHIKSHLHGELDKAVGASGIAVAMVAFLAVVREGLETAIFLWAGIRASGEGGTAVGERIERSLGLPVEYEDERYTSVEAERLGGRDRPADDLAAVLILAQRQAALVAKQAAIQGVAG